MGIREFSDNVFFPQTRCQKVELRPASKCCSLRQKCVKKSVIPVTFIGLLVNSAYTYFYQIRTGAFSCISLKLLICGVLFLISVCSSTSTATIMLLVCHFVECLTPQIWLDILVTMCGIFRKGEVLFATHFGFCVAKEAVISAWI